MGTDPLCVVAPTARNSLADLRGACGLADDDLDAAVLLAPGEGLVVRDWRALTAACAS